MSRRPVRSLLILTAALSVCGPAAEVAAPSDAAPIPTAAATWMRDTLADLSSHGAAQLEVGRHQSDPLDLTVLRLVHRHEGLRVVGSDAVVATRPDGSLRASMDKLVRDLEVNTTPAVSESQAWKTALARHPDGVTVVDSELVVFARVREVALAWALHIEGDPRRVLTIGTAELWAPAAFLEWVPVLGRLSRWYRA